MFLFSWGQAPKPPSSLRSICVTKSQQVTDICGQNNDRDRQVLQTEKVTHDRSIDVEEHGRTTNQGRSIICDVFPLFFG